jgi:hypothetical protein
MGFAQILARKLGFLLNFSPDIGFFTDFFAARKLGFCLDFRVSFKYSDHGGHFFRELPPPPLPPRGLRLLAYLFSQALRHL